MKEHVTCAGVYALSGCSRLRTFFTSLQSIFDTMNSQDAFRKFAQQLQRASQSGGGGGMPGGPGRFLAGGGLMVALVGGGLLLNASLFNGASRVGIFVAVSDNSNKSMVVTELSNILGRLLCHASSKLMLIPASVSRVLRMRCTTKGHISWSVPLFFNAFLFFYAPQVPWFETPIVFDIRAKPRSVASLTGTKGDVCGLRHSCIRLIWNFRSANGQHHLQSSVPAGCICSTSNIPRTRKRL